MLAWIPPKRGLNRLISSVENDSELAICHGSNQVRCGPRRKQSRVQSANTRRHDGRAHSSLWLTRVVWRLAADHCEARRRVRAGAGGEEAASAGGCRTNAEHTTTVFKSAQRSAALASLGVGSFGRVFAGSSVDHIDIETISMSSGERPDSRKRLMGSQRALIGACWLLNVLRTTSNRTRRTRPQLALIGASFVPPCLQRLGGECDKLSKRLQVRADVEHASHPKRSAAPSSWVVVLSFGSVIEPSVVRTMSFRTGGATHSQKRRPRLALNGARFVHGAPCRRPARR